jgi:hypothetical protein
MSTPRKLCHNENVRQYVRSSAGFSVPEMLHLCHGLSLVVVDGDHSARQMRRSYLRSLICYQSGRMPYRIFVFVAP